MKQGCSVPIPRPCGVVPFVLVAAAACSACSPALAQTVPAWTTLGPPGGTVSAMLVDPATPTTLYAGTPENGVFVSSDGGTNWSVGNAGLAAAIVGRQSLFAVHALVANARDVYAATGAGVVYTPLGAAPNWTALADTGASTPVTMLAFDPASGLLFAASPAADGISTPGVYVASSIGAPGTALAWTFVALPSATIGSGVSGLAVASPNGPTNPASLLVSAGGMVYAAPISAAFLVAPTWTNADPTATLAPGGIAALAYSGSFLQAIACSGGSVDVSGNVLDPQALWSPGVVDAPGMVAPVCNAFMDISVASGGTPQLVLGTDQGAFVSVDGVNFAPTMALGPSTAAESFAVGQRPGAATPLLYVGTGFGVSTALASAVRSGTSWTPSNGPAAIASGTASGRLDNVSVVDSASIGTRLFAAAVDDRYAEVFASTDGGATWMATGIGSVLGMGESITCLQADTSNQLLYAATTQGLLAYDPATGSWSAVSPGTIAGRASALALGATALFVGTDNGVFAVPLGHAPASAVPIAAGLAGSSVRSLLVASGTVMAGIIDATDNNYVWFTTEAGATQGTGLWQAFAVGSAGTARITSLLFVGTTLLAATNGNLVLYASAGSGWASANTSADASQQISDTFGAVHSLYSDGATIFAATGSQGVYASPVGSSFFWTPFDGSGATALPSMEVRRLRAGDGVVYASTRAGVASFVDAALAPPPPASSPPPPAPAPSGSGGGAVDPWWVLALLASLAGLGSRKARSRAGLRRP